MSRKRSNQLSYGSVATKFIMGGEGLGALLSRHALWHVFRSRSATRSINCSYSSQFICRAPSSPSFFILIFFMGGEGLEPSQPYGHRILSPTCIPIPPPALNLHYECASTIVFLNDSACICYYKFDSLSAAESGRPPALKHLKNLEAWSGIEPLNSGFADHCLTTWLPRRRRF